MPEPKDTTQPMPASENPVGNRDRIRWKWLAIGSTVVLAILLTVLLTFGLSDYGITLFILVPILIGVAPAVIYGSRYEVTINQCWQLSLITLGISLSSFFFVGIEGLICIAMALPFGVVLAGVGVIIGYAILKSMRKKGPTVLMILIVLIPLVAHIEKESEPVLDQVITSIEIKANPQTVWKHVIEFPKLEDPTELIFKVGIAYPTDATIDGSGVGAVRHCNFTTGRFVEPITVWDEPHLLAFDVLEQPVPMREISFWDIDAPHLHDYFVSKKGQFTLTQLPNGNTLLEGTTWYYHDIRPRIYWRLWSDHIIHKIHERVLKHIKERAEE